MKVTGKVLGIDLAGLPKNDTGLCALNGKESNVKTVKDNEEIIKEVEKHDSELIAIDGPISKPKDGKYRQCDRELNEYGALPPLMSRGMKKLTERAIGIAQDLEKENYKVIEVFPTATAELLGLKKEKGEEQRLQKQLLSIGLKGTVERRILNEDEADAVLAALTASLHLQGKTREIGDENGKIVIPDLGV